MPVNRVVRFGLVNTYLVEEKDGLTVIDTMVPRSAKSILAAAETLGKPITTILLTHPHGDHVGSLDELHAALPDAAVVISERDARYLDKVMTLDPGEPQAKLRGGWPGAENFLDVRDRTLYAGDAYSTVGGVATAAKGRPVFPLVSIATWHKPTALESAKALRALEPTRLAPGHGKVVESPGAAMDAAIRRSE